MQWSGGKNQAVQCVHTGRCRYAKCLHMCQGWRGSLRLTKGYQYDAVEGHWREESLEHTINCRKRGPPAHRPRPRRRSGTSLFLFGAPLRGRPCLLPPTVPGRRPGGIASWVIPLALKSSIKSPRCCALAHPDPRRFAGLRRNRPRAAGAQPNGTPPDLRAGWRRARCNSPSAATACAATTGSRCLREGNGQPWQLTPIS
jgi:hypothetical protein